MHVNSFVGLQENRERWQDMDLEPLVMVRLVMSANKLLLFGFALSTHFTATSLTPFPLTLTSQANYKLRHKNAYSYSILPLKFCNSIAHTEFAGNDQWSFSEIKLIDLVPIYRHFEPINTKCLETHVWSLTWKKNPEVLRLSITSCEALYKKENEGGNRFGGELYGE